MVDALNMEMKELMDSYQQLLENMSKEELISEIGRLLVDKGLLLNSRDGYINELKEDNNRLNGLLADGTEVMDYWQDKYLEEKSKNDELQKQIDECNRDCEEYAIENGELQQQVNELKEHQVIECYGMLKGCDMVKQAVKDTSKEILTEIGESDILVINTQEYGEIEVVPIERLKEIIKQKGMKVEW